MRSIQYPVEVRASVGVVRLTAGAGLFLALGASALAILLYLDSDPAAWVFATIAGLVWAFAIYVVALVVVARTSLYADRIVRRDLFRTQERQHGEIVGWRVRTNTSVLLETQDERRRLVITGEVLMSQAWCDWLETVPNLDERDAEALVADPRLGATPEERAANLHGLRRSVGLVISASFAVGLWVLFWPRPYEVAVGVAAVLPLIAYAAALLRPGLFSLTEDDRRAFKPDLSMVWAFPGLAVVLRAMSDVHLLDLEAALTLGALIAAPFWLALLYADRRARVWWNAAFSALVVYGWATGSLVLANALLDRSPPRIVETRIVAKSGAPDDDPRFDLQQVGGAGERFAGMAATSEAWNAAQIGDRCRVLIRPGRLGWRWLERTECE